MSKGGCGVVVGGAKAYRERAEKRQQALEKCYS